MIYVVSYRNSTSNHNSCLCISEETALYLIEILHQTTTQTLPVIWHIGCILSKFYIKPQPFRYYSQCHFVVSYRNSTSNHNRPNIRRKVSTVVSYRNSTSNHNRPNIRRKVSTVVSYRNSTSNHNYKVDQK